MGPNLHILLLLLIIIIYEILQLVKFEGANFKYDNIDFKFQLKNTLITYFGPRFRDFYFYTKLCNKTISRELISNMTILFSNSSPKRPELRFFGCKFKDFYFSTSFYCKANSRKLISNMRIFVFKFQPKNTQISHFWSQILTFFLSQNFAIRKIRGCWFKIWQYMLKTLSQKYQNKLVPKLKLFMLKDLPFLHYCKT